MPFSAGGLQTFLRVPAGNCPFSSCLPGASMVAFFSPATVLLPGSSSQDGGIPPPSRPFLRCVWGRPTFIHGCTASCLELCFLTCKIESLPSQGQVHLLVCSIKSRNEEERKQNSTFRLTYRGTSGTQGPVHCSSYLLPTQSPGTGQWPGRQLS